MKDKFEICLPHQQVAQFPQRTRPRVKVMFYRKSNFAMNFVADQKTMSCTSGKRCVTRVMAKNMIFSTNEFHLKPVLFAETGPNGDKEVKVSMTRIVRGF